MQKIGKKILAILVGLLLLVLLISDRFYSSGEYIII